MSFSVAGLYYNCIHTRPCTYHTCMGPIIPYTSGNTEDNTQHSLGPISEPFFSQNVLAGHTQRKLWFHKYIVQIFPLAHALQILRMSFSVAGLYYNCIHTRPCTYHTCMGPIIPYTSGNTEDNTQHSLGPISEPFFSQNVLAGHTQRKLWFHKYLVQIFRLAHASLGGYTLLPVVENVCFEIRICEGVCYLGCCTRTGHWISRRII